MPSFDIVSEVDKQELDNALNQARKELATRFDFKGTTAEIVQEKDKITLTAEDAARLRGLREIVIGKLSKRGVDLRNVEQVDPAISPSWACAAGIENPAGPGGREGEGNHTGDQGPGIQSAKSVAGTADSRDRKKRDDLQDVIAFVRGRDFEVATAFKNFRD